MQFLSKTMCGHRITIPSEIVEAYDINDGDFLQLDLVRVKKK